MTWIVEVTRKVRLALPASGDSEAREMGLSAAWEWLPEQAEGGDQGSASVRVVRAGDLPGALAIDDEAGEGCAVSDRAGLPSSFDEILAREPGGDPVRVTPERTEVAVVSFPGGAVVRVRQWLPKAGFWAFNDYGDEQDPDDDWPLIAAIPGDKDHLGWGARYCGYGSLAGIRNGHHARDRAVWHAAAKAISKGGVAYVRHEQRDWFGRQLWVAVSIRTEADRA